MFKETQTELGDIKILEIDEWEAANGREDFLAKGSSLAKIDRSALADLPIDGSRGTHA